MLHQWGWSIWRNFFAIGRDPDPVSPTSQSSTLFLTSGLDEVGWLTPRLGRSTPGNYPLPIVQEAGWASGPVWTGFNSRTVQPIANRYSDYTVTDHPQFIFISLSRYCINPLLGSKSVLHTRIRCLRYSLRYSPYTWNWWALLFVWWMYAGCHCTCKLTRACTI
jgi:hypothetical protein